MMSTMNSDWVKRSPLFFCFHFYVCPAVCPMLLLFCTSYVITFLSVLEIKELMSLIVTLKVKNKGQRSNFQNVPGRLKIHSCDGQGVVIILMTTKIAVCDLEGQK